MGEHALERPVRVGIIGAGSVLWAYLQLLDRLTPRGYAEEGIIVARNADRAREIAGRRPHSQIAADVDEVLDSNADLVVILTPPESHPELTRRALAAGKHVVVEKPIAPTPAIARELFADAEERGLLLLAAPFVQLAPTIRELSHELGAGAIGRIHTARGLYGTPGAEWARWYHESGVGPIGDTGVYNLKTITLVLGPVVEVVAMEMSSGVRRAVAGEVIAAPDADVHHVMLRHDDGAISSIVASHAIQAYRRPAVEFYGTSGTANLLGDDWDPRGYAIWRRSTGHWEEHDPPDATWLWSDGLREAVLSLREGRSPRVDPDHDVHVVELLAAARLAAETGERVSVTSRFTPQVAELDRPAGEHRGPVHDHTRPADEQ